MTSEESENAAGRAVRGTRRSPVYRLKWLKRIGYEPPEQPRNQAVESVARKRSRRQIDESPLDLSGDGLVRAEKMFLERAKQKSLTVWRNGWPDFLVDSPVHGGLVAVEVKSESDRLSRRQAAMFSALERVGLRVFVWSPEEPSVLTPWRRFHDRRLERRSVSRAAHRAESIRVAKLERLAAKAKRRSENQRRHQEAQRALMNRRHSKQAKQDGA